VYTKFGKDSFYVEKNSVEQYMGVLSKIYRYTKFDIKVATYSKVLMIIAIPLFALIFLLFFYKQLQYYGSALILASHFMVYNLCFFLFHILINIIPRKNFDIEVGGFILNPIFIFFSKRQQNIFLHLFLEMSLNCCILYFGFLGFLLPINVCLILFGGETY
jgi:hypothetical protein